MPDPLLPAPECAAFAPPAHELIAAGVAILAQGEELLATLTDDAYTRHLAVAWNGSIGGHYRHCLDHFQSLLLGVGDCEVDYDHRQRDARVETDRACARQLTRDLRGRLAILPEFLLDQPVAARCEVSYGHDGDSAPRSGASLSIPSRTRSITTR
jgi:hypothetical protein